MMMYNNIGTWCSLKGGMKYSLLVAPKAYEHA